jgi:SAM-dependent methyltransferase
MTSGAMERTQPMGIGLARRPAAAVILGALLVLPGCTELKRLGYQGFGRDGWQHPERVVEALSLVPGERVADLGSGGGYFTFRLAEAVGSSGKVYAVDVDEGLNDYVRREARKRDLGNVEVVLADAADPGLPEAGIDLLFSCNTYHHLEDRAAYFENVRRVLRPEGRVAIIDFDRPSWLRRHFTSRDQLRQEMREAGYRMAAEHDFLPRQLFVVFTPSPAP